MRIAFLSDTHGNFAALQSVLADLKNQSPDQVVFLGDAVTIGPRPAETLECIRSMEGVCIMGNHDEAVLYPERATDLQISAPLHPALHWAIEHMSPADLDFLRSFRPTYELEVNARFSILCFHGSPRSNTDVLLSTTSADALDELFAGQSAPIWIGGHTHVQMFRRLGTKLLLNPGSVGNAFKFAYVDGRTPVLLPWSEYAILDVEGPSLSVDLRRVPFDTDEVLRDMAASGNPSAGWWLEQYQ